MPDRPLNPDEFGPTQLQMFMSPRDVGQTVTHYGDFGPNPGGGLPHEVDGAKAKLKEARQSGMSKSIAKEGVKRPIALTHTPRGVEVVNGHSRLVVQSSVDPGRLMPVEHWDDPLGTNFGMFDDDITQDVDPKGLERR